MTWFEAIRLLLLRPTFGTTELCIRLGISRSTTVRNMARKIRAAMTEENASELLAGLDVYFAQCATTIPESGAPQDRNMVPGSEGIQVSPESDVNPVDIKG